MLSYSYLSWKVAWFVTSETNCPRESYSSSSPGREPGSVWPRMPSPEVSFLNVCTWCVCQTNAPSKAQTAEKLRATGGSMAHLMVGITWLQQRKVFLLHFWIAELNFIMLLTLGLLQVSQGNERTRLTPGEHHLVQCMTGTELCRTGSSHCGLYSKSILSPVFYMACELRMVLIFLNEYTSTY